MCVVHQILLHCEWHLFAARAAILSSLQESNQLPTQRVMVRGMLGGGREGDFP
jgi:hypothetical protein